ncbi:hypothetical protein MCOR25_003032 [Pyricularia grisea]|uniref:Uncharacterized protein n=1 Tax=Pyricularia grisea TaxID=148305 RepID=A0A6P8B7W1_PYRGI|nr:hypothetical protein PgNI_05327 [Pyricularia grisea]KAI6375138.1 hypothetical protein MCOR25_003032 [Pyricularia grisea]TLD11407.1 hypothetical protein PgNI_05327 [Pyricularia grisea]
MTITRLATLILASLMVSHITASPVDTSASSSSSSDALRADSVAVHTADGVRVMTRAAYMSKLKEDGVQIGAPATHEGLVTYNAQQLAEFEAAQAVNKSSDAPPVTGALLSRRDKCQNKKWVLVDNTTTFVDADVQMSPVVCAQGSIMVAVANGYMVSNTIGISSGLSPTIVKDALSSSLGIEFSRSWTTSSVITTTGTVTDKNCGVMITQPMITRRTGRVMQGCIDNTEQIGTFHADSHKEITISSMKWVEGAISMCMKAGVKPPLSRCNGDGNFV